MLAACQCFVVGNTGNYQTNPEVTMTDETLAERNVLITAGYKLVKANKFFITLVSNLS